MIMSATRSKGCPAPFERSAAMAERRGSPPTSQKPRFYAGFTILFLSCEYPTRVSLATGRSEQSALTPGPRANAGISFSFGQRPGAPAIAMVIKQRCAIGRQPDDICSFRALLPLTRSGPGSKGRRGHTSGNGSADPPRGLIYCAAERIGACPFKKRRTRSIVRCLSSSDSFHGNIVISAFGASEATSIEVCSGCPVRHRAAPALACGSS
jgi:hypothetical protein